MTVVAAALESYDLTTLREDLSDAENMISPSETPFMSLIASKGKATNKLHEWPLTELGAVDSANRVIEGEAAPTVDAPVVASRRQNYTQISDKVVMVTDSVVKMDGAANIQSFAKQIAYKLKELKRDMETMLLSKTIAAAGAGGGGASARATAGLYCFIITNASRGASGTAPTLSGGTAGFPNATGTAGTLRDLTEDMLNQVIQSIWTQGGRARYALVTAINKRRISQVFNGYATKFKDADDKKLTNAIDVYESDFGQVQIVPDRFNSAAGGPVFLLDPEYVAVDYVLNTRQVPLARTGHAESVLIQNEYALMVGNEKAIGVVADTNG